MIMGMAMAWAWGVIAMKAALATRPAAETLAREQLLAQTASREGTTAQLLIYDGFMLDTRVTVTYFCMLGLFLYFMVGCLTCCYPCNELTSLGTPAREGTETGLGWCLFLDHY